MGNEEHVVVEVKTLIREDVVSFNEKGGVVEKGFVLHGCCPPLINGDIVIAVNGQKFTTKEDFFRLLNTGSSSGCLKLILNRTKGTEFKATPSEETPSESSEVIDRYIIELVRTNTSENFGLTTILKSEVVLVSEVFGIAKNAGIKSEDRILFLNGDRVSTCADVDRILADQMRVTIHLERGKPLPKKSEMEDKIISFKIPFESGDILGIKLSSDLIIKNIQSGCLGEDKFELDDQIVEINGVKLSDEKSYYCFLRHADDDLYISVKRKIAKEVEAPKEAAKTHLVLVSLVMDPCEPLGIRPDEKLLISSVQTKSHATGKFELGDLIKFINGIKITDRNRFLNLLEEESKKGRVNIIVERSIERELELEMRQLPPNIEKIIKRHIGFDYLAINVKYIPKGGRTFGLNINNVTSHKIIVTEVNEGTVAGDFFKVYDRIVAINGNPVSDSQIAKRIIRECKANFQAIVERPIILQTQAQLKKEVDEWRIKSNAPKNLEEMPPDVQEIVLNQIKRNASIPPKQLTSALRKSNSGAPNTHISFVDKHVETQIQSDVPISKRLRSLK